MLNKYTDWMGGMEGGKLVLGLIERENGYHGVSVLFELLVGGTG